jgi:hypothetical protein
MAIKRVSRSIDKKEGVLMRGAKAGKWWHKETSYVLINNKNILIINTYLMINSIKNFRTTFLTNTSDSARPALPACRR